MTVRMLVMVFPVFFECPIQVFQLDQFHLYLMLLFVFFVWGSFCVTCNLFVHFKLFTWYTTFAIHSMIHINLFLHSLISGNIVGCPIQCKDKQTRGHDVQETFHLSGRTIMVFCRLEKLFIGLVDLNICFFNVFLNLLDFIFLGE